MFRRLFRALRHFLGATILVIGSVCLIEVILGARHANQLTANRVETIDDLTVPSAIAFQTLRPLARLQTSGGLLTTNSFGLRGSQPAMPKPPGTFRVLVLGDDATLAKHLPASDTACRQLEQLLVGRTAIPVEVINGGQPGACPLTLSLLYQHQLAALHADAVVLVLSADDVVDDVRYRAFLQTDAERKPIACPHPSLGGREQTLDIWRDEFRLVDLAAKAGVEQWLDRGTRLRSDMLCESRRAEWLKGASNAWTAAVKTSLEPIVQLKADVEANYGRFLIAIAPDVSTLDTNPPALAPGWQAVIEFAAANEITLLNPTNQFHLTPAPEELFVSMAAPVDEENPECVICTTPLSADGHKLLAYDLAIEIASMPGLSLATSDLAPAPPQ